MRTQKLIAVVIKNEMDLHQKVIAYIRKYNPDVMMNASLGENQDSSEKVIKSYKAGLSKRHTRSKYNESKFQI